MASRVRSLDAAVRQVPRTTVRAGTLSQRLRATRPGYEPVLDEATLDASLVQTLASAIESRSGHHSDHAARIAAHAMALTREVTGREPDRHLYYGFLLHDVGEVMIPDRILLKSGDLDDDERAIVRVHPTAGFDLLRPQGLSGDALKIVRHHHERWDGSGYPAGLRGSRIPIAARALSVVDAYDSMTHARPYRRAMDHDCAVAELRRKGGSQFDPACVDAFIGLARSLDL